MCYQTRRRKDVEGQLDLEGVHRDGRRVGRLWLIRAGLANPAIPMRTLRNLFSEHPADEQEAISSTYVGCARDAFTELLEQFNKKKLAKLVCLHLQRHSVQKLRLCIQHVHDEASMRVRSCLATIAHGVQLPESLGKLARGPSSKIPYNAIHIFCGGLSLEWWSELQALAQKNG